MPCDTKSRAQRAREARERQIKALEAQLKAKSARVTRVGNKISIEGWSERGDWCDECALRALRQSADFEVRRAIAAAVPASAGIVFGYGHTH